jgi:peptide-methionine (S)-S-oxide reductase
MPRPSFQRLAGAAIGVAAVAALGIVLLGAPVAVRAKDASRVMPAPEVDMPAAGTGLQTAVFAGGCFWGIQGVFQHVSGVTRAVSGYAGGTVADPSYEMVSTGTTGYAESVRVTFDPSRVTYGRLLQIFFSVALDPTQVDGQGPDSGTQYRSELFVADPAQARVAHAYLAQLTAAHVFARPIATRVDPAGTFYPAEEYHQDYLTLHPTSFYIAANDIPKVNALQRLFPGNWREKPVTVGHLAQGS